MRGRAGTSDVGIGLDEIYEPLLQTSLAPMALVALYALTRVVPDADGWIHVYDFDSDSDPFTSIPVLRVKRGRWFVPGTTAQQQEPAA